MKKKNVYIFIFDGYSDWEPSYASVELNKSETYQLATFSIDNKPVKSAGGLTLVPDFLITNIDPANAELIIIPGGTAWEEKKYRQLIPLIGECNRLGKIIAAICGGTVLLADMGLLNDTVHTSNALVYIKHYSADYKGDTHYQEKPAVTGKNIITANGVYPIEFAKEIFTALHIMNAAATEKWFQLFKNGIWEE